MPRQHRRPSVDADPPELTHLDAQGAAQMVQIDHKPETTRRAVDIKVLIEQIREQVQHKALR